MDGLLMDGFAGDLLMYEFVGDLLVDGFAGHLLMDGFAGNLLMECVAGVSCVAGLLLEGRTGDTPTGPDRGPQLSKDPPATRQRHTPRPYDANAL